MVYTAASAVSTNLSSRSSLRCIAASLSAPAASADDIVAAHKTPPLVKPKSRRQEGSRGKIRTDLSVLLPHPLVHGLHARQRHAVRVHARDQRLRLAEPTCHPQPQTRQIIFDNGVAQKACSMATDAPIRRWKSWAVGPTWRTPSPCALYRQLRTGSASRPSRSAVRFSSAKSRFDLTSDSADLHPQTVSRLSSLYAQQAKRDHSSHQVQRVLSHQEPEPEARCAPTLPSELVNSL